MYKTILLTIALITTCGLGISAEAQNRKSAFRLPPPPPVETTITQKITAVEVSDGVIGWDNNGWDTMFGYGFSGQATGDVSGVFDMSMNCLPSYWKPGSSNEITGGMWTLPIYAYPPKGFGQVYAGSMFGKITGGKMGWSDEGAEIYIDLEITGGTLAWKGVTGKGTFKGTLVQTKEEETLNGELTLTYTSH